MNQRILIGIALAALLLAAFTGGALAQGQVLTMDMLGRALAELAMQVNGQQEKIEMLEKQLHFTYQELKLLRLTAVGGEEAENISFAGLVLYMDDLQAEGSTRETPTQGRLPESEMDYALRLLRLLEHCEGDDVWEVLEMIDSRADRMEENDIIWQVPFRAGRTFFRFKLLDAIEMLGPGELSCDQFLEVKTNEVLAEYEKGQQ